MTIAVMKQALECLESLAAEPPGVRALHPNAVVIQNLRAALAEAERVVTIGHKTYVQQGGYLMGEAEQQGPVAWGRDDGTYITNAEHNELLHHDNWAQGFDTALYTTPQPATPVWQPIETAPKDGTVFLGYRDGRMREAYRVPRDDCEMWVFGGSSGSVEIAPQLKPTHWMPLLAAPKPGENHD